MRFITVSDWQGPPIDDLYELVSAIDNLDFLVYGGDGLSRFYKEGTNHLEQIAEETNHGKVLAVGGNDDISERANRVFDSDAVNDLHANPHIVENTAFLGAEGKVYDSPGVVSPSEDERVVHLAEQFDDSVDTTVLVSHVPPHGILDLARRYGEDQVGSKAVREFIEENEILLTICGHCHQCGGQTKEFEWGKVLNIASHDEEGAVGRFAVIEMDEGTPSIELSTVREELGGRLTDLFQVGRKRVSHFKDIGITEISDVTPEKREDLKSIPGGSDWHADRWIAHAEALQNDEVVLIEDDFPYLDSKNIVLIDIETNLSTNRIWLVGLYSYSLESFSQVFELDDEETLLESVFEFLNHCEEQENMPPEIVYYGGNNFDEQVLLNRSDAHQIREARYYLHNAHDLGIDVRNSLVGPTRYRLDAVAEKLDYDYEHPDIDGFEVGMAYSRYCSEEGEPTQNNVDWKQYKEYNRDDVFALKSIVDFIRETKRAQK